MKREPNWADISHMLPTDQYNKGMTLVWEKPYSFDPVRLKLKGETLFEWDYIPSLAEVFEVCKGR